MDQASKEYRCGCGKLLCRGLLLSGFIEIKCKRCQNLAVFNGDSEQSDIDEIKINKSEN